MHRLIRCLSCVPQWLLQCLLSHLHTAWALCLLPAGKMWTSIHSHISLCLQSWLASKHRTILSAGTGLEKIQTQTSLWARDDNCVTGHPRRAFLFCIQGNWQHHAAKDDVAFVCPWIQSLYLQPALTKSCEIHGVDGVLDWLLYSIK